MLHPAVPLPALSYFNSDVRFWRRVAHVRRPVFRSSYLALSVLTFVSLSLLVTIALALTLAALAAVLVLRLAWWAISSVSQAAKRDWRKTTSHHPTLKGHVS